MDEKKFSIGESLRFGKDAFKVNLWFMISMFGFIVVVSGLPDILSAIGVNEVVYSAVDLAAQIVNILFSIAMIRASIEMCKNKQLKVSDIGRLLTVRLDFFFRYVGLSIVTGVIIFFGFLLFIIPGIVLSLRYFFAPYFLIEYDLPIGQAMKKSAEATKGYKMDLFLFTLACAGIIYAALIPLVVIAFVSYYSSAVIVGLIIIIAVVVAVLVFILYFAGVTGIASAYIYKKFDATPSENEVLPEKLITEELLRE